MQVIGNDERDNRTYAKKLLKRISEVPGIADPRIQQAFNAPTLNVDVDRTFAGEVGLTERDAASTCSIRSPAASRPRRPSG